MTSSEEWRKIIFSLSDQSFFDLVRNYLGDVKTPFNKHELVDELECFLLKNTERIVSLIDKDDVAFLSAIDLLEGASEEELFEVFRESYSYYSFYAHLLNLEERMLICKQGGIILSPLFRKELREKVIDYDVLFSAKLKALKRVSGYPWYSIPVVFAFISWLLKENDILKNDFSFKKKFEAEIGSMFGLSCGEMLKNVVIRSSLLHLSGRRLVPIKENFEALFALDDEHGSEFFIDSFLAENPSEQAVYSNMRTDRVYSEKGFCSFVACSALAAKLPVPDWKNVMQKFIDAGLVEKSTSGIYRVEYASMKKRGKVVVQPDFSLYAEGCFSMEESMAIALCSEIRELGELSRYEITRDSFMRGVRSGIHANRFISKLEALSSSAVPQNVVYSLASWEEECRGVSIYQGYVIKTDARISKLLEGNSTFCEYSYKKLGDGIFLVSEEDFPAVRMIVENVSGQNLMLPWKKKSQSSISISVHKHPFSVRFLNYRKPDGHITKTGRMDFYKKVKALDMPKDQQEVLVDRVKRKLILSENQIASAAVRYEMTEAKGLDYAGKLHLCQYVIEHGNSFLELSMGEGVCILMKPVQLKKSGTDRLLIGEEIPGGKSIQIALRKVRLVRKIRMSLMG